MIIRQLLLSGIDEDNFLDWISESRMHELLGQWQWRAERNKKNIETE